MNNLKRIFISLKSQIDNVADEFENHEALASAAIQDLEAIGAKTSIHLQRVKRMSQQYEQQLTTLNKEAQRWSDRAVKVRDEDEQKALQCIKRLRITRQQIEQIEHHLISAKTQETKIQSDLNAVQNQLLALKNKKEILSARQNSTLAKGVMEKNNGYKSTEATDIFQRWEETVSGVEFTHLEAMEIDSFASAFEQEEDDIELKMMLDKLTQKPTSSESE